MMIIDEFSALLVSVCRLSTLSFPMMSSSKSSFEVSHSGSSYLSSSTVPTDYSTQQHANLKMVKSTSSYISNELDDDNDDDLSQRLVKLRKVPQRQLQTPTKTYTRPESSPSRTHEWRKNLRTNGMLVTLCLISQHPVLVIFSFIVVVNIYIPEREVVLSQKFSHLVTP